MSLFKSKSAPKEEPQFVLVYRGVGTPGMAETATRAQCLEAFRGCLYTIDPGSGDYAVTPYSGRRVFVTGPDYCIQPEDHSDPLLIGTAALREVLSPAEYAAIVQAPFAAAALEA
jgi:hypothetical protein